MSMIDPKGAQPEALARFAEAARKDDGKPLRPGLAANQQTKPIPADPELKQDAATKLLREGVLHRDEDAGEASDRLPGRIVKKI